MFSYINYFLSILLLGRTSHMLYKRSFTGLEIIYLSGILKGTDAIFLTKSFSVLDSQGVHPVNNS